MKETDKLLVSAYASFLVDPDSFKILDYNDYASRYISGDNQQNNITDIIEWNEKISKNIDFRKDKKMILSTKEQNTNNEVIIIVQKIIYNDGTYYNVTLIDNLEDLRDLDKKSIDHEIATSGLFSNIFKYSPIGLVLVDSDTRLYKANKYMFDCFDLEFKEVIGERFGNVFGCSTVSESRFLCGEADGCQECKLRNGVTSVLNSEYTLEGVELGHDFEINGRTVTKWFTISASQVEYGKDIYALVSFVDITQRVRMEDRLRKLGITDPLTLLYNRRHIMTLYRDSLLTSKHTHVAVSLIDIDNFKTVNDVYGHLEGDKILILLGDILKEELRFSDYAGRYGGEEFLIILPDTQMDAAKDVISRIQEKFRIKSRELIGEAITFSVGLTEVVCSFDVEEDHLRAILNQADKLMYEAKALGKDRIQANKFKP